MKPGEAMGAYRANNAAARDLALEATPLYQPLAELAARALPEQWPNCTRGLAPWSETQLATRNAGRKRQTF